MSFSFPSSAFDAGNVAAALAELKSEKDKLSRARIHAVNYSKILTKNSYNQADRSRGGWRARGRGGRSRNAVPTPAAATSPASNRQGWLKALLSFPSIVFPPFPYLTKVKKRKIVKQGQREQQGRKCQPRTFDSERRVFQHIATIGAEFGDKKEAYSPTATTERSVVGGATSRANDFGLVLQETQHQEVIPAESLSAIKRAVSYSNGILPALDVSKMWQLKEAQRILEIQVLEQVVKFPATLSYANLLSLLYVLQPAARSVCALAWAFAARLGDVLLIRTSNVCVNSRGNECIGDVCRGKRREDEASGVLCQDARSKGPDGLNSKNHHDEERVKVPFSNAMEESITQANKGSRNLCVRSALRPSNVQKELIADNGTTWRAIGNTDNDQWPCFAGNAPQVPELGKICYGSAQKANGGFSDFIREQGDTRNDRRRRRIVKDVWLGGYKTVQKNADTSNWPFTRKDGSPNRHGKVDRIANRSRSQRAVEGTVQDGYLTVCVVVNQKPKNHHISMADIQQLLKAGIIEFAPEDIVYGDILCFDVPEVSKHRRRWINATYSINELLVESQQFSLTNVKRIKELVLAHSKKGHVVASFDQSAAYHQLHIRGEVRKYFRFINNNVTYQLCRAATGDAHMCSVQQAVAEAFISVEIPDGVSAFAYLDNYFFLGPPECVVPLAKRIRKNMAFCNATVNEDITALDASSPRCDVLGISIDLELSSVNVTCKFREKLDVLLLSDFDAMTLDEFFSMAGKLFWASTVKEFSLAKFFYCMKLLRRRCRQFVRGEVIFFKRTRS